MKKLLGILVVAAFVLGLRGVCFAEVKFAYVDLSKIFSEYYKTKTYDKVLGDKENAYTADRDKKVNDIKQLQDKINLLSEKEKNAKKAELEQKIKTLQDYDRDKQTDLRKDQDEKMKEILKDIEDSVKKVAEKEGYAFVFNDRVLVYQNKAFEVTDKVLEILNKGKR